MAAVDDPLPLPRGRLLDRLVVDAHSAVWWDAARRGELLVTHCAACLKSSYPPRPFCPDCWSEDVGWRKVSGAARLYTWSVVRVNDSCPSYLTLPYVVAMVDLEEGPRLATVLPDVDPDGLRIGLPLRVRFDLVAPGVALAMFVLGDGAVGADHRGSTT